LAVQHYVILLYIPGFSYIVDVFLCSLHCCCIQYLHLWISVDVNFF